jgi:MinD-like ATPase involved in chromosome partitioning or flagellar assembly
MGSQAMGATALSARLPLPLPLRARRDLATSCGLAFDVPGGPLVAVCALVGGSGASTLAFALAQQAARESSAPVLLAESDARRAGLALLAGQASPLCLLRLARDVADGRAPHRPFIELDAGLRMIASAPHPVAAPDPADVRALLRDARAAHGVVIVDCGTAWAEARPVLEEATHIVWTVTAEHTAVARARVLFASEALPPQGRSREILVALRLERGRRASVRALRRLASQRCERLVLAAQSDALPDGEVPATDSRLGRTLTGLAHTLRRDHAQ